MAMEDTEEQLNNFDKTTLVQLFLVQQSQLADIDKKLQLLLEQVAVLNNNRFGKSSEKLVTDDQICFLEVDGNIIYFNEAEAVASRTRQTLRSGFRKGVSLRPVPVRTRTPLLQRTEQL